MAVSYYATPSTEEERRELDRLVAEWYSWGEIDFDQRRYPWYDPAWLDDPRRAAVVERIRAVGLVGG